VPTVQPIMEPAQRWLWAGSGCSRTPGVPLLRLHHLRHSFASLMLEQRVNVKIVSELLGHSGVQITLDSYSHV
jgi:integrase